MLSQADLAIVARDRALPGLGLILDAASLARRLGWISARHVYLRYKPRTSCVAGLLAEDAFGAYAAHAYPPERYAEVRARPEWRDKPGVHFLDADCVVLVAAMYDRGVRALRRLSDPERGDKAVFELLGGETPRGAVAQSVLRYKPRRRLVSRVDVDGRARVAVKALTPGDFTKTLIGATGAAALGGAQVVGADAERSMLAIEWIEGRPLCPEIGGETPSPDELHATGEALARLHMAGFRPVRRLRRSEELSGLLDAPAALDALDPELGAAARPLAEEIAARLERAPLRRETLIHGDFTADQVVMRAGAPVILDWDSAASGDPANDLGTFLARLDAQAIDGLFTSDAARNLGQSLLAGYAARAKALPDGLAEQHARALMMLATEGFRRRIADWPERTAAVLACAREVVGGGRGVLSDPAMPALAGALDPGVMRGHLARAIGGEAEVEAARLVRHKPGRRALVRYDVRVGGGASRPLLGKLRAKGADRRTARLHEALRAAGLDGADPDGVGVPQAFGRVDALHLWFQDLVPGRPAGDFLTPGGDAAPFALVGRALARLHAAAVEIGRVWTLDDETNVLAQALEKAAGQLPEEAARIRAIGAQARARVDALPPGRSCGIHRDFYFDQALVDGNRVWLLDFDLYTRGDPAIDIGNFLAHLDELGLRLHGDLAAFAPQGEAFLAGYEAAGGRRPEAETIAGFRMLSLARHIFISLRFSDRRHTTRALIDLLEADPARAPETRLRAGSG